jgi:hypothetical protein
MVMMSLPMVSLTVFVVMLAGFGLAVAICQSRKPAIPQLHDADAEWYDLCERLRHPIRRQFRRLFRSRN